MSAARKITIPYLEEQSGYLITAKDSKTAKRLEKSGFKMRFKEGMFSLKVEELPEINGVVFKRHKLKVPKLDERKEIEKEYKKLLKMEKAMELMLDKIDEQREKVSGMVGKTGLKLKPSLPKDSQLYMRGMNTRLHNCISVTKDYDLDAIEKTIKKYPILERCFDLKQLVLDFSELTPKEIETVEKIAKKYDMVFNSKFNKATFDDVSTSLPPSVKEKLVKMDSYMNFRETHLPSPECVHCGGKIRKDATCKRCQLPQELE